MKNLPLSLCLLSVFAGLVSAQSTISSTDKYSYSANAGWINFHPSDADGVVVAETCLSGKAYAANFGWIDLGDGTPVNGYSYANNSASDFGVNLSANGELSGYAYAANAGWIRFEQTYGKPMLDMLTGKLSGYAYSGNLGWIALDTSFSDLATTRLAAPDSDGDGIGDAYERLYAGNLTTMNSASDWDGDGVKDRAEYVANTQPNNAGDCLRIIGQAHNGDHTSVTIQFTSRSGRLYSIRHSADLAGTWTDSGWGRFVADAGSTTTRSFTHSGGPRHFFRVAAHLPLQP